MSRLESLIERSKQKRLLATIHVPIEASETLRVAAKCMGVSKKSLMEEIFQEGYELFLQKTKRSKVPI